MTVTVAQNGFLVRLAGTIAEVLAEVKEQELTNIIWYTDDGTDAKMLCSRLNK